MEKGFFSPSVRWFGWVRLGIMLCSLEEGGERADRCQGRSAMGIVIQQSAPK